MELNQELTPSPTISLDQIPEDHQEIVGLYEEAFYMPTRTPDDIDKRNEQLVATDSLASETVDDITVKQLRHLAFLRVEDAKRRQAVRLGGDTVADAPIPASTTETPKSLVKLPIIRAEQMRRAMARMGYVEVKGRGKGSHRVLYNPETGNTAIVPEHLIPRTLEAILKQAGISRERLKENL